MHKLAQSVLAYVRKHDLVRPGERVGIAVSGGADSVALLRILLELRPEIGIVPSVVHLNHKLRSTESDLDEQFVRDLAANYDLQLFCETRNVKSYAAKNKLSLETGARDVRYLFFEEALEGGSLDKITTAHTLDDQAETVLLKLTRGAGTRGLAGIYPKISHQQSAISFQAHKAIVRPLLGSKRSQIEAYLREIGQSWREDSTNRELRHTRNRIRHEILPRLEEHVNPRAREALGDAAEIARAEDEYWSEKIAQLLPQVWSRCRDGGNLDQTELKKLGLAVQRRLIRAAAGSLSIILEFQHVQEVLALNAEVRRATLPNGWSALWCDGEIRFEHGKKEPCEYELPLPVPGKLHILEAGVLIEALLVSKELGPENQTNPQSCSGLIDPQLVVDGLMVRNWRPGDRFWPSHTKSPKKLKELLQDRRIIGTAKKLWPVVASGGEVVWVRGLGVSRGFQSGEGTRGILIRESPLD